MAIDYDTFLSWATDRFGEANLKFRKGGQEICTHSFFVDGDPNFPDGDRKFKLWMNPSGGKDEHENGAFRCWYTDNMGSLIKLVSIVDNIPFEQAAETICTTIPLRALEIKVHEFYNSDDEPEPEVVKSELELPPYSFRLEDMSPSGFTYLRATEYLDSRKLPYDGLYACTDGDYKNRIVIPYYDRDGELIYYNCRTLDKNPRVLRYMKPPPEDASQNEVLFAKKWPRLGTRVYLTEGEFDAMTLTLAGFYGVACAGKFLSSKQVEMLRGYRITLAFDSDDAGSQALMNIGEILLSAGFSDMQYIRPPKVFKDWNKLLEKRDIDTLRAYIQNFEKPYNAWTASTLIAKRL